MSRRPSGIRAGTEWIACSGQRDGERTRRPGKSAAAPNELGGWNFIAFVKTGIQRARDGRIQRGSPKTHFARGASGGMAREGKVTVSPAERKEGRVGEWN